MMDMPIILAVNILRNSIRVAPNWNRAIQIYPPPLLLIFDGNGFIIFQHGIKRLDRGGPVTSLDKDWPY